MAATRLIAMHIQKNRSVQQCIKDRTDYAENGEKTENGEYISSYECDPETVDKEFDLSKVDIDRLLAGAGKMISLLIKSGSPSNLEKLHRRKQIRLVMKQQCDGRKVIMFL